MKYIIYLFVFFVGLLPAKAQDSPEVLDWVEKTAVGLESKLNDAVSFPGVANLLLKLAECYETFDAVAMVGLYCDDARIAAEQGRHSCNWIYFIKEADIASLTVRAQEARLHAFKMQDAARYCRLNNQAQPSSPKVLTFADVIRSNADAIEHDLSDGLASGDIHILVQKTEHAQRTFRDNEVLTHTLNHCAAVLNASREGFQSCTDALISKNWTEMGQFVKKALDCAALIKKNALTCD